MGVMEALAHTVELYRRGRVREAEAACEDFLALSVEHAGMLELLGEIQLALGKIPAAIASLSRLAALRPSDAANLRRLGGALLSTDDAIEAAKVLRRALDIEPGNIRAHNNLGQALLRSGQIPEAIRHFERALSLNPDYSIGHNNLGQALIAGGEFAGAVAPLQRAIALDPSLVEAWVNLGVAFERTDDLKLALQTLEEARILFPCTADVWAERGVVLSRLNRTDAALDSFDTSIGLRPRDATTLARKASLLMSLARSDEALRTADEALRCREGYAEALNIKAAALTQLNRPLHALPWIDRALALDTGYVEGWRTRAIIHQNLGDHRTAVSCYRQALALDPGCVLARTGLLSALIPWIPLSQGETDEARTLFDTELSAFEQWLGKHRLASGDAWSMARQSFFYLSYQEQSNKSLLQRYRRASHFQLQCVLQATPSRSASQGSDALRPRCRLGIVSAHVFEHSVFAAIVQGWLRCLDRDRFEIHVFSLGAQRDSMTQRAAAEVDHFEQEPRAVAEWARLIEHRQLDALIFPEVGMDADTLALAALRLAPRQFASWGHPETTGMPTIDCYLSAEGFEPPDADSHYTEQLIRLPNLGVHYQPHAVTPTPVDFAQYGIPGDVPVFICPGTPFKYRPQDDDVLVDIACRLGRCAFVFFQHAKGELSGRLHTRMAAAFRLAGLKPEQFLFSVPWLPRAAFLGLMRRADVYLDTIGFSGFNTLMQAVQVHLPAVTMEGRFMRGRLGSGILRRLGMPELIAETKTRYVDVAVALAEDAAYRMRMRHRLQLVEKLAYNDLSAIEALSRVLLS
jgi:predicted O-linked N-acetylglucosamine transferase (SPINDLY family)